MPSETALPQQISAIREFNRFYTARLGLLRKRHLDGEFSLTEARILYEIGARPHITASRLCASLELDPGYISRLLAALTRHKLIRQTGSKIDGREKLLSLSAAGTSALSRLNQQSDFQIQSILSSLDPARRNTVAVALTRVREILSAAHEGSIQIIRLTKASKDALGILEEYYEAVHVVKRDKPQDLQALLDEPTSGMWLACLGDSVVGCVVLRKLSSIPLAAECKRLYVRPAARGKHVATLLLDVLDEHARVHGFQWIYLDTYDDLKPAIALYQRRGYEQCARYNDNPQATLFMRKRIGSESLNGPALR